MAHAPPPCSNCHGQPVAICASCVRKRLAQHRTAHTTLSTSLERHTAKAGETLAGSGGLTEARALDGQLASSQRTVDAVRDEAGRLRSKIAADRARVVSLRTSLAERRTTLATLDSAPPATLPRALLELQLRSLDPYAPALLQTRQVLLSELLRVFDVRVYADDSDDSDDDDDDGFFKRSEGEDEREAAGARRPGGRTRGEWMIGNGLILPLPGDIHLYPAEQTNAALTSTLHLLSLFATYLSPPAGLPFVPFLRPPSLLPSPSFAPSPLASTPDLGALLAKHSPRGVFPLHVPQRQPDLLLAGLAALQYDVVCLAAQVGVAVPLNESGHVLFNLYRIALELTAPAEDPTAGASAVAPKPAVEPVSLERIVLSLRGTLAPSSSASNPFGGGGGPSAKGAAAASRKEEEREARRKAKDAVKATETADERDERRRKRRAKRAERERREAEREAWELVGDSLESIRHEGTAT